VNPLTGAGETAGIDYRDETAQQFQIEHGIFELPTIHFSTDYEFII